MQHDFILLDRSGSMTTLWKEAIGSINGYVKKLAEEKVDTGVTLVTFDLAGPGMSFDILRDRITPATWRDVDIKESEPRGSTPLNDATAKIVHMAKAGNYDKVAIIVMTDGHENSSREYTVQQVKQLLDTCRAKGWQVIFLGANFDNAQQAASYGTAAGQTISASAANLAGTMSNMATARSSYASTGQAMEFTDDEKKKAAK